MIVKISASAAVAYLFLVNSEWPDPREAWWRVTCLLLALLGVWF